MKKCEYWFLINWFLIKHCVNCAFNFKQVMKSTFNLKLRVENTEILAMTYTGRREFKLILWTQQSSLIHSKENRSSLAISYTEEKTINHIPPTIPHVGQTQWILKRLNSIFTLYQPFDSSLLFTIKELDTGWKCNPNVRVLSEKSSHILNGRASSISTT